MLPATTTLDKQDLNAGLTLCLSPARPPVTSDVGSQWSLLLSDISVFSPVFSACKLQRNGTARFE